MPGANAARPGQRVLVKGRKIDFSFWPSRPGRRHRGLQSRLFALDPWAIIRQTVESECPSPRSRRNEALATLEQAEDFYVMGTERGAEAAQPLALYYSYMNLSKTFCLTRGARTTFDQAQHGLKERLGGQRRELVDAYLVADTSSQNTAQNFDELLRALASTPLAAQTTYHLPGAASTDITRSPPVGPGRRKSRTVHRHSRSAILAGRCNSLPMASHLPPRRRPLEIERQPPADVVGIRIGGNVPRGPVGRGRPNLPRADHDAAMPEQLPGR